MRKIIVFVLSLTLILAATQSVIAEAYDFTGIWVPEAYRIQGLDLSPAVFEGSVTLVLKDDGSFVLSGTTQNSETTASDPDLTGTWTVEENTFVLTISEDGSTLTGYYSPQKQRLVFSDELFTVVMAREGEAVVSAAAPVPVPTAAESEEAFLGTWRMCATSYNGIYFPLPDSDTNGTLILNNGTCIMIRTESRTGEPIEYALNTRFEDGGLGLYNYEYSYDRTTPGTLWMTDDGTLCLLTHYDYAYYYSRVE